MFKVSIPSPKLLSCDSWACFFDLFCQSVKDEDILEKYATILELNEESLLESFIPEMVLEFQGLIQAGVNASWEDIRVIIEGSKDHKSMTFSFDCLDRHGQKAIVPYFRVNQDDLEIILPSV